MRFNLLLVTVSALRILEEPAQNCTNTTIPFFKPSDSGKEGGNYTRVVPDTFGDNMLHTIIKQYAVETKMSDGKPSGKFYLDKDGSEIMCKAAIKNYLTGEKAKEAEKKIPALWEKFDVNKQG